MPLAMAAWVESKAPGDDSAFISLRGDSACYKVYYSADGQPLALGAIEPKFWTRFCLAVDMPQWVDQHTVRDQQPALIKAVAALFKTKTASEWSALLEVADCCFTRVIAPEQLLNDPHIRARGLVGISERGLPWMRSPIRLSGDEIELHEAPAYAEHTRELLAAIGYGEAEIEGLIDAGIILQAP